MNRHRIMAALSALVLLASTGRAQDAAKKTLEVTDDSEFDFTAYKIIGKQECSFLLYEGTVELTGDKIETAKIEGQVDVDSILNNSKTLVKILKSDKFFDAANHPECSFSSTKIVKGKGTDRYDVTGDLEIRGTSKSVTIPSTITWKDGVFTFTAKWQVNRQDWGLSYKGLGDSAIKDMVDMSWTIVAEPK